MHLEKILKTSISRLKHEEFDNMAQIKQAVILPILRELGWDDSDPKAFRPKCEIASDLFDYVLFDSEKPQILIKTKLIIDDYREQNSLPGFQPNHMISFFILTDGNQWDFYRFVEGIPSASLFISLQLENESKFQKNLESFNDFLLKSNVLSGKSRDKAFQQHARNMRQKKANGILKNVYKTLLEEPNMILRDLLIEKVENECGIRPDIGFTESFLKNQGALIEIGKPTHKDSKPWIGKGVTLPEGTQLQMYYRGNRYAGIVKNGLWEVNGNLYKSPSTAAGDSARTKDGTNPSLNGWKYWQVKRPEDANWISLDELRYSNDQVEGIIFDGITLE